MHGQASIDGAHQDFPGDADRTASGESPIVFADFTVSVGALVAALEGHPAWGRYGERATGSYVHGEMKDIWVRFNAWENYNPKTGLAPMNDEHESVWYPVAYEVPQIRLAINDVLAHLGDVELGGVLITKIPPGCSIKPHVDGGWHAGYYRDKFAVQLKGTLDQAFNFEGFSLSALPGQVYSFDNSKLHWVTNDSDEDRITMIICTRRKR